MAKVIFNGELLNPHYDPTTYTYYPAPEPYESNADPEAYWHISGDAMHYVPGQSFQEPQIGEQDGDSN